jgi:hypothetical protein
MATKITSFEFEDDDESEEEEPRQEDREKRQVEEPTPVITITSPEAEAEVEVPSTSKEPEQTIQVHFEVVSPLSEEKDKDAGLVDKGRRCIEKAQKPFWPSPAQCMPVRIAG